MNDKRLQETGAKRFNEVGKLIVISRCMALLFVIGLTGCAVLPKKSAEAEFKKRHKVSLEDVEYFALRSAAAYDAPATIQKKFPNTVHVATPGTTGVQYFVEHSDATKVQTIAVRGTANRKNVFEDLAFGKVKNEHLGIVVHRGFNDAAAELYRDISPLLKKSCRTDLTGHSLGGSVAAILALYLEKAGYDVGSVVTFGQPKFTNLEGVSKVRDLNLLRVVHHRDLVPMLPPSSWFHPKHGSFGHLGSEVIVEDSGHHFYLAEHDAERLSVGVFWRNLLHWSASDHHIGGYLGSLRQAIKGGDKAIPERISDSR